MKKLSVTVSGDTLEELAGNVVALGAELNSLGANSGNETASTGGTSSAAPKGKDAGKGGKSAAPTKEDKEETATDPLDDDLGFEDKEEKETMSRDDFVVAVRDFAKKKDGNKAKVKAALDKMKLKSVQDVKEKDFEAFLKGLK